MKYIEGTETLQQHINKLTLITQQLINLGEPPSPYIFITVIFTSLPDTYRSIINILELQKDLTPEIVINTLLEEDRRRTLELSSIDTSTTAFTVQSKKGKQKNKALIYNYCKRSGHIEKQCWKKYPEKRPNKDNKKSNTLKANKVEVEHEDDDQPTVFYAKTVKKNNRSIYD